MQTQLTQRQLNHLTYEIIGAAIDVHKQLGPGLLEQVYEVCLIHELQRRQLNVCHKQQVPILYKGCKLETLLRLDILVEDCIVVEIKSVEKMQPVFEAQLLTYMNLLEKPKGILLNFYCTNIFREGQKTLVNEVFRALPKE